MPSPPSQQFSTHSSLQFVRYVETLDFFNYAKSIMQFYQGWGPPLHGGELHCNFGAIWIRHHGAMDT